MSCEGCAYNGRFGCEAEPDDYCQAEEASQEEVVVPCKCGADIDGYQVCPHCGRERG